MKRQYEYRLTMHLVIDDVHGRRDEWVLSTHDGQRIHQTLWAAERMLEYIQANGTVPHRIERRSVNPWHVVT